nr:hypothetical protein Iba_chr11aCG7610 [Ipomoea batatas]
MSSHEVAVLQRQLNKPKRDRILEKEKKVYCCDWRYEVVNLLLVEKEKKGSELTTNPAVLYSPVLELHRVDSALPAGAISLFLFGLNQSVLSVPGTVAHEGDMDSNSTANALEIQYWGFLNSVRPDVVNELFVFCSDLEGSVMEDVELRMGANAGTIAHATLAFASDAKSSGKKA